jgi:hypothetical protein
MIKIDFTKIYYINNNILTLKFNNPLFIIIFVKIILFLNKNYNYF